MALAGTLKDFSLADIFQLIGLQKKTGILTLTNEKEEARILFMNGLVVGADTNSQKLENHLGHVLVKSKRISQEELEQVLAIQSQTLQRLGQVLIQKGYIKPEDLRESLQTQTTQIIYRLFRWCDGEYHFQQERYVDYDQENFTPITSESILMEGVRMLDEWPMIETLIPNFDVLLEKTVKGANLKLDVDHNFSLDASVGESFDTLLEGVLSESRDEERDSEHPKLTHKQEIIMKLVDGTSVVQEIIDQSGMNEFETCRSLFDLIQMGYIGPVRSLDTDTGIKVIEEEHQLPVWIPACLIAVIALFSFVVAWNPLNDFMPMPFRIEKNPDQYLANTRYHLDRVAEAIYLYYLREEELPPTLGALTRTGLIQDWAIRDPLGRDLQYEPQFDLNSYRLSGLNQEGHKVPGILDREIQFSMESPPEEPDLE